MEFTTNSQIMQDWIKNLRLDGISDKTIRWYGYGLKRFNSYTDKPYDSVTINDIKDFITWLKDNGYSTSTQKGNYTTLKVFFNYLVTNNYIEVNPFNKSKTPKFSHKQIYSFKTPEIIEIMKSFDKKDFCGYRDYAIFSTLLSTGIRKAELVNMKLGDVAYDGVGYFRVVGKGNRTRVVPIGNVLSKILKNYIKRRQKFLASKNLPASIYSLWVNNRGEPLTASGVDGIFDRLKQLDYPWSTRVSAHTVRHTFAVTFLVNGGDVFSLQKIMGHSDISTTKVYIDLKTDYIKRQGDNFNPLDNTTWRMY